MTTLPPARLRIPGIIARDLGIDIVSGKLQPGQVLEGEVASSTRHKVSRSAYREAVRILTAKGLVRSKPKMGTRISTRAAWHVLDPDVISWIFQFEPDEGILANLFALRKIVEPEAAALAAVHRTQDHLDRMAAALVGMRRHTLKNKDGQIADQQFHEALIEAANNIFVCSLSSSVSAAVAWTTKYKQRFVPLSRDPIPEHQAVYDAIAAGKPKAAKAAMWYLIDLAFKDTTSAPKAAPAARGKAPAKKKSTLKPGRRKPR